MPSLRASCLVLAGATVGSTVALPAPASAGASASASATISAAAIVVTSPAATTPSGHDVQPIVLRSAASSSRASAHPSTAPQASPPGARAQARRGRFAVGDSLTVAVAPSLRRQGFRINAAVGRQFGVARSILRSESLPRNVVVALGTNGPVSLSACRAVVRAVGPHRRVFLVNNRVPRSWQAANNATLRRCDRGFRAKRVRVVDWHGASAGRRSLLAPDGYHLSAAGRAAFARLIDKAVDRYGI